MQQLALLGTSACSRYLIVHFVLDIRTSILPARTTLLAWCKNDEYSIAYVTYFSQRLSSALRSRPSCRRCDRFQLPSNLQQVSQPSTSQIFFYIQMCRCSKKCSNGPTVEENDRLQFSITLIIQKKKYEANLFDQPLQRRWL